MTDKMTLITIKKTGHILGVVTRESDPEGTLEPADVAGEELLVRFAGNPTSALFDLAQFLVPADELALEVKDYDEMVVTRARDFYLNADKDVVGTAGSAPTIANPATKTQITVNAVGVVLEKTPVWVQISSSIDPTNTQVRQGEIDANQSTVVLDVLPLDTGVHYVLTLVGGRGQAVEDITAP